MTRLEAILIARETVESLASELGIPTGELLSRKTAVAVAGRRRLTAELLKRMPVSAIADVLGLSPAGVRLLLGPLRPPPPPPKQVWCARHGDDLLVCTSYKSARIAVLDLRKSGIKGADVVRREVGVA